MLYDVGCECVFVWWMRSLRCSLLWMDLFHKERAVLIYLLFRRPIANKVETKEGEGTWEGGILAGPTPQLLWSKQRFNYRKARHASLLWWCGWCHSIYICVLLKTILLGQQKQEREQLFAWRICVSRDFLCSFISFCHQSLSRHWFIFTQTNPQFLWSGFCCHPRKSKQI
jgi:hypothetical protein